MYVVLYFQKYLKSQHNSKYCTTIFTNQTVDVISVRPEHQVNSAAVKAWQSVSRMKTTFGDVDGVQTSKVFSLS